MGWGGRREEGSGWGAHVHPWLIHVNVWQKPPQYCKVISLQLNFKKIKKRIKTNNKIKTLNELKATSPTLIKGINEMKN